MGEKGGRDGRMGKRKEGRGEVMNRSEDVTLKLS